MLRTGDVLVWLGVGSVAVIGGYFAIREFAPELIPADTVPDDAGDGTLQIDYEAGENESPETTAIAQDEQEQALASYFN